MNSNKSKISCNKGFTLIELLVVVLIIGILAAIAVPQYRVAVQKARLIRLIPLVDALYKAEESYFLTNGEYTNNLDALDVPLLKGTCQKKTSGTGHAWLACSNYSVGVFDGPTNAQIILMNGSNKTVLAYLHFFADDTVTEAKKGDIACFANDELHHKICRSLGPSKEFTNIGGWKFISIFS